MSRLTARTSALPLAGAVGPLLFAATTTICAALQPDYSSITNLVSELGASGAPHAELMNYAGFIPTGACVAAFGVGLVAVLPRHRLQTLAAAFIVLFGMGVIASGLISCDQGCPRPGAGGTLQNLLHDRIAPISFLCIITSAGLSGVYFRVVLRWKRLANYSFVTAGLALIFLLLLASSLETRTFAGIWQRLMLSALFLWCAMVGMRAHRFAIRLRQATPRLTRQGLEFP